MTTDEIRAILTICLLASYADGEKHDREREQIRQVAESLSQDQQINLPGLYTEVLMRRVQLADVLPRLTSQESRALAYEMAVCVCDADGSTSIKEEAFLSALRQSLGLGGSTAPGASGNTPPVGASLAPAAATVAAVAASTSPTEVYRQAQEIANANLQGPVLEASAWSDASAASTDIAPHPVGVDLIAPTAAAQRQTSTIAPEEMDRKILNASIMNGAIELLPENLSTLAIIPLQMRLVYQIGQSYGYELDKGHIKDFLATMGVGLTSQYLEQAGRKLLSGLLGKGILGGLGRQAVSSGMSFASTYALGHVANQYYAGGRTLTTQMLQDAYRHVMQDGQKLQSQYLPQMQQTARGLNMSKILSMVRGN